MSEAGAIEMEVKVEAAVEAEVEGGEDMGKGVTETEVVVVATVSGGSM